jgi:hypothetical protein
VEFGVLGAARQLRISRFVKPADDKCFPAKVYASGAELPTAVDLPDSTAVLSAEPVTWEVEYRCFVMDRQVLAHSVYLRNGELAQDVDGSWNGSESEMRDALDFAQTVLGDPAISFPPAVVLDVGMISGRGWAVVETNAAWGSGIYGCDPAAVLQVVERACVSRDRLSDNDRAWVIR